MPWPTNCYLRPQFESSLRNTSDYRTSGAKAGEVKTKSVRVTLTSLIAREVIKKIGYTKGEYMFESNFCGVLSAIHEQSPDINRGVERQIRWNRVQRPGYDVWLRYQ